MTAIGGIVFLAITTRARNDSDVPGYPIVLRHHDRLLARFVEGKYATASLIRHIHGAVSGRHLDVTMQAGAIGDREHWRRNLTEEEATVVAAERPRIGDALRSVVDRVWIEWSGVRQRRVISSASERLVVDVGRNNTVTRSKVIAVVIG